MSQAKNGFFFLDTKMYIRWTLILSNEPEGYCHCLFNARYSPPLSHEGSASSCGQPSDGSVSFGIVFSTFQTGPGRATSDIVESTTWYSVSDRTVTEMGPASTIAPHNLQLLEGQRSTPISASRVHG
jgi:hypothetical protein